MCDTVNVEFPDMRVSATAKCVKTEYDVLIEKYNSVDLGDARTNIADTISEQKKELEKRPTDSIMQAAIMSLTASILGASGGAVRLLDTNDDGLPDTLYVADDPDPAQAVKVWRWNYEGWGASSHGYNGPFTLGATLNDGIVADFITAGTLSANLIRAGILKSLDGETFFLDLENGILRMKADSLSISGKTMDQISNEILASANDYANTAAAGAVSSQTQLDIFNKLTNNGQTQGIYLSNGKIYINADYMKSGTIDANSITLSGKFRVGGADYTDGYIGRVYGSDDSGVTVGVGITNTGSSLGGNRVMVTDKGASLSAEGNSIFVPASGTPGVVGGFNITGNLNVNGSISGSINSSYGDISSFDVGDMFLSGRFRPNNGQNALYCDWRQVELADGSYGYALCGFTSPQG